jgi:hypothetical protein
LAIFSIIFVDKDNFLKEYIEEKKNEKETKFFSYSQAANVEIDASILSIGGNCP